MGQRLIDANALMERLERKKCEPAKVRYTEGFNDALMRFRSMVHGAPTVDAVQVVRCKDCVHGIYGTDETGEYRWCENACNYVDDDAYCADGERKESNNE